MTDTTFTPERSDAMRAAIVRHVDEAAAPAGRRQRRLLTAVLTSVTGFLVVGGGLTAASAAGLISWPFTDSDPLPGGETSVVVAPADPVGDARSEALVLDEVGRGSAEILIPAIPDNATHLSVEFSCLTIDSFSWGLDPENNPGLSCGAADLESGSASAWYDFPLHAEPTTFYIGADEDARWRISAAFVTKTTTSWSINDNGQTYGVINENGTPDLLAVVATNGVEGYAIADELDEASGASAAKTFDSPEDALEWQEERNGKTLRVPVYQSDGETIVGEFVIGG